MPMLTSAANSRICASGRYARYLSFLPRSGTMVITAETTAKTLRWLIMTPCEKLYKHEFYLNKKLWRMLPQKEKQALISLHIPNDLI
jgi:hypothetical protein